MIDLRLRSIEWLERDACRTEFETPTGTLTTVFRLERSPVGVLAQADPDVFLNCNGTATEIRAITGAVVRFCLVAQGESEGA